MIMDLNQYFKSTCKILLGSEIGRLDEFGPYLLEIVDSPMKAKSALSGKPVYLSRPYYCKQARFVDAVEMKNPGAISINEIKDIDSLVAAMSEELYYCGNKNLGVSQNLEESDMCNDSVNLLCTYNVMNSKNVAFSNGIRKSEYVFGCMLGGEVSFCLRCQIVFYSQRCFETYMSEKCSDAYCSFNCRNCADVMFCFNQHSKKKAIGNIELPADKYVGLKDKLKGEIAQMLKEKKSFPSLFEVAQGGVADA